MSFRALVVDKSEDGTIRQSVETLEDGRLPSGGDVTVAVEFSSLNYKDGLCLTGGGGLVRTYPHVPGIDLAGTVAASDDSRYVTGHTIFVDGRQPPDDARLGPRLYPLRDDVRIEEEGHRSTSRGTLLRRRTRSRERRSGRDHAGSDECLHLSHWFSPVMAKGPAIAGQRPTRVPSVLFVRWASRYAGY